MREMLILPNSLLTPVGVWGSAVSLVASAAPSTSAALRQAHPYQQLSSHHIRPCVNARLTGQFGGTILGSPTGSDPLLSVRQSVGGTTSIVPPLASTGVSGRSTGRSTSSSSRGSGGTASTGSFSVSTGTGLASLVLARGCQVWGKTTISIPHVSTSKA